MDAFQILLKKAFSKRDLFYKSDIIRNYGDELL